MAEKEVKKPAVKKVAKTPVVMQMEALECGAACLCMVLAYYDKWVPLEQVRSDCGVSRDGSNAKNILMAARNYHLEADGYKVEPEVLEKEGVFPCIVHWEFNHFIVVNGFKGDKVYINDPARGSITITKERFDEGFTGIALLFEPGEEFAPGGKQRSMLDFTKERLKGSAQAVFFVTLTTVITALVSIISAGLTRIFLDQLLPGRNHGWIIPFFTGFSVLALLQVIAGWIGAIYSMRLNGKMDASGSCSYMWRVLRLPVEFFSQRMAGDIQTRKTSNASIAGTLVNTVAPLALNTAMMIFYLVVMVRYSITLTCVGILSVIINMSVSKYISQKRVNITRVAMRDNGKLASATVSGIELVESIKASGAENGYFEKWSGYQASVNTQNVRYLKQDEMLSLIPNTVSTLMNLLVLVMGAWFVIKGYFTVGMVMAFQGFMTQFISPATQLIGAGQTIREMRTDMERVEDVMNYPLDPVFETDTETDSFAKLSGAITMKDVTFGYSKLDVPLIENFSMELKQGASVAFVGATGCGKSTLAKLISGLYRPWSGQILFDGKTIDEIDRNIFTGSVSVVDQDIILFEDTISENIKMWDNSIEDFEMIMAARDAGIHDEIMHRTGDYQYRLTEGGKDFSGGQRQRLEIARVLSGDPTLIILDEATSALDSLTETKVMRAIKDRGITCVIIAHRLSTIRDCDEIIVLDHGKVVERGTHDELMKLSGKYKMLVSGE